MLDILSMFISLRRIMYVSVFISTIGILIFVDDLVLVLGSWFGDKLFDASYADFIFNSLILLLPTYLFMGYITRIVFIHWLINRTIANETVIAQYDLQSVLPAVEAGLVIDNDFRIQEALALLYDLHYRNVIVISKSEFGYDVQVGQIFPQQGYEEMFVDQLFQNSQLDYASVSMERLAEIALQLKQTILAKYDTPALHINIEDRKFIRNLYKAVLYLGALFSAYYSILLIFQPRKLLFLINKDNVLQGSEVLLVIGISVLYCLTIFSAFWVVSRWNKQTLKPQVLAAGLALYIEKTMKGRFYSNGVSYLSASDVKRYYPYAVALGIESVYPELINV